jgi:hypothetical protein
MPVGLFFPLLIKIFTFYKKKNLSTDMCSTHVEALE